MRRSPVSGWRHRALLGLLLLVPVSGLADSWRSLGPGGGSVWCLAADSHSPSTLYAGAWRGGVFKTTDAASTWQAVGPTDELITAVAVDPKTSSVVYAGGQYGLYRSDNAGSSWHLVDDIRVPYLPPDQNSGSFLASQPYAIVFNPADARRILMATVNDVFISTNDGATFTAIQAPFFTIKTLAIDPHVPSTTLAGTYRNDYIANKPDFEGIFKTTDSGGTWKKVLAATTDVNSVVFDARNAGVAYAATNQGLFKSVDSGETWAQLAVQTETSFIDIRIDPLDSRKLYASTLFVTYRSEDAGATWIFPQTVIGPYAIYQLLPGPWGLLVASDGGVYQSADGGNTWRDSNAGLHALLLLSLAQTGSDPATLYVATLFDEVFRSDDGGGSWKNTYGSGLRTARELLADPRDPGVVYAMSYDRLSKTTDGGTTWVQGPDPTDLSKALAMDPSDPATLYFVEGPEGPLSRIHKTTDSGAHWDPLTQIPIDVQSFAVDPKDPKTFIAGIAPSGSQVGGVFRSADGGLTWTAFSEGLGPPNTTRLETLVFDPVDSNVIYGTASVGDGDSHRGVFKSLDGGRTWARRSDGFTNLYVFALAVDPVDTSIVFAGTDKGFFISYDGADSWSPWNEGLIANASVRAIAVDARQRIARIATFGGGVFERALPETPRSAPVRPGRPRPPTKRENPRIAR